MANSWGELSWSIGSWGQQNDVSVSLTGQQVNCAQNNVGVSAEVNEGWGRLTWGENAWGIAGDVIVTGIGLNVGIGTGSVTIDVAPELTGEQQNISLNNVEIDIAVEVFLDQNPLPNLTIAEGTIDPAPDALVTGQQQNLSTGNLEAYNSEGWGRLYWGEEVWGATGFWAFANTTGVQINASVGTVDAKPVTIAEPSGIGLTAEEGTVDPSPDATVVGIGLTASVALGSVVEADANVTTTGNALEIAQGQAELDANTIASITGQQLNIALQGVVAGASANVNVTGIALITGVRNINVQAWQFVDTGTSVNWNDIDTAA